MIANQSRHTVQFSDLAWESTAPQLPRAWQVGHYLERYRDRYCRDADIRLGMRVEKVTPALTVADDGTSHTAWHLKARSSDGAVQEDQVDYLVIATGYFGRPAMPTLSANNSDIPVIHSSAYRDLSSLLGTSKRRGRKILVVGGQMSGVEIAGTVASHLSSAANSPSPCSIPDLEEFSVQHVIQRPVWVFPLFTSPDVSQSLHLHS